METSVNKFEKNFQQKLEDSKEFVNYWIEIICRKLCLKLTPVYSSNLQKKSLCDTQEGIEFKWDDIQGDTKNFWIEFKEKHNPAQEEYVNSGILRKDNSWLWAIGDFEKLYFLPKRALLNEHKTKKWEEKENHKKTSWGMVLPQYRAKEISILELTH
jgi:hypothetical protein